MAFSMHSIPPLIAIILQVLSANYNKDLLSVNCHLSMEAADFLGRLRPASSEKQNATGALFEWIEGPLVKSLKNGFPILIDEINLASDSVLERLNSVLEPERELLLTDNVEKVEMVQARDGFQLAATMNPAGDYGKKELSKALRNRLTEIWCPCEYSHRDLVQISGKSLENFDLEIGQKIANLIADFAHWFNEKYGTSVRC